VIDPYDASGYSISLALGESLHLEYLVVPVLYSVRAGIDIDDATIGTEETRVLSDWGIVRASFDRPWDSRGSVSDAIGAADYLIVTNPQRLFDLNPADQVNELLSTMAELAQLKTGVLGHLWPASLTCPYLTDDYIESWGRHLRGSEPGDTVGGYLSNGYLLIVGEDEIVSARSWDIGAPW
jgi:hypothetical protein